MKNNPELQIVEPTLKSYTPYQREKFKSMLDTIFRLPINQGIRTTTRTSQNEAFNWIKLVYLDKRIDYWMTYPVRHALAILHNNEGICEMMNVARLACNVILSDQDLTNISKIEMVCITIKINLFYFKIKLLLLKIFFSFVENK